METWNREELYAAIWEQPASKVAAKYGISDVMLGKVCRRLSIPVPGRGYWARKAAGQKLTQPPLPVLKNVPFMQRFKMPDENANAQSQTPVPKPTDLEYLRIKELGEWVIGWSRAKEIREFVAELEAYWVSGGEDISSTSSHGHRLKWMRQQADRFDPLVESPPSVLDRKHELRHWG